MNAYQSQHYKRDAKPNTNENIEIEDQLENDELTEAVL